MNSCVTAETAIEYGYDGLHCVVGRTKEQEQYE